MGGLEVVSALAAVLAVVCWLPPPAAARLGAGVGGPGATERSAPGWLRPVPDALSPAARGALSTLLGLAGWLALGLSAGGVVLASLLGLAAWFGLGRVPAGGASRRQEALAAALPQACDLLAAVVSAGLPLRTGVELVGPAVGGTLGELLGELAAKVALGVPEDEAWREWEDEPVLELPAREIARAVGTGAGLGPLLHALALGARREAAATAQVRARKVGVASVLPLMACFLPSFVLLGVVPIIGGIVTGAFG